MRGLVRADQRQDEIGDDGDRQIPARWIEDDGYGWRAGGESIIVTGDGDERVEAGGVGGPREAEVGAGRRTAIRLAVDIKSNVADEAVVIL